jgi:hypothetical protein
VRRSVLRGALTSSSMELALAPQPAPVRRVQAEPQPPAGERRERRAASDFLRAAVRPIRRVLDDRPPAAVPMDLVASQAAPALRVEAARAEGVRAAGARDPLSADLMVRPGAAG